MQGKQRENAMENDSHCGLMPFLSYEPARNCASVELRYARRSRVLYALENVHRSVTLTSLLKEQFPRGVAFRYGTFR